jgi:hypothetical protein
LEQSGGELPAGESGRDVDGFTGRRLIEFYSDGNTMDCQAAASAAIPIILPVHHDNAPKSNSSLGVLVFVNGFRSSAPGFNLQLLQPVYDLNMKQINVTVVTDATVTPDLLFLTYVLLDIAKLGVTFTYAFTSTPQSADYILNGLVGVTTTLPALKTASFSLNRTRSLACFGLVCEGCVSAASCKSMGGSTTGNLCWKCGLSQTYSATVGCICQPGTYLLNNVCSQCPSGTQLNPTTSNCEPICGPNSVLVNSKCSCSSGFQNISGTCQACPQGTIFSAAISSCVSICTGGQ